MVKKKPTQAEIEDAYKKGTAAKATKWQKAFLDTTGIAAAAASDDAQGNYVEKMTNPAVLATRQKELKKLTDEDFKAPVRTGGPALYSTATATKAPKMAKDVMPYVDKIWEVLPTLASKVDDVDANIDNRVKPLARALRDLKRGAS